MDHAIISGSTGLIGSALVKFLLSKKIKVLCLGRNNLSSSEIIKKFGVKIDYLSIDMKNINTLPEKIKKNNFQLSKKCVFFSIAWSGDVSLTDGNLQKQFMNSIYTSEALKVAKDIGCEKFINFGSIQETLAEYNKKNDLNFNNSQMNYTISKLASCDMCLMLGYLEKIDYIHTRLSVPIDPKSEKAGYIAKVLSSIKNNISYLNPKNSQQFDLTHIDDICNAYYLIALYGKNKSDYYIGTSNSLTLKEYFDIAKDFFNGKRDINKIKFNSDKIFNTDKLVNDTGFILKNQYFDILKSL